MKKIVILGPRGQQTRIFFSKKNKTSILGCQIVSTTPARGARTGVKKDIVAVDHEAPAVSTSAKKPRRSARDSTAVSTAASDNMKKAGGGGQEENDIKLTMTSTRSKKISTRGGGSGGRNQMLDKGMMDNPFAKKTTVRKEIRHQK